MMIAYTIMTDEYLTSFSNIPDVLSLSITLSLLPMT